MSSVFFKKGKKVSFVCGEVSHIKPFTLKNRDEFLEIIVDAFTVFAAKQAKAKQVKEADAVKIIFNAAKDKLVDIYGLVLEDKTLEWIKENITMRDEMLIIETVVEVNDIPFLLQAAKRLQEQKMQ